MLTNEIMLRLFVAFVLGSLLGIERTYAGKTAGIRTFALVSLGSALAIIISEQVITHYIALNASSAFRFDPLRLMAGLIQGIGFIGAGMIIFQRNHVANLTTAAGVWIAATIGMAIGFGLYREAIFVTLLVVFTFSLMWKMEKKLRDFFGVRDEK